MNLLSSKVFSTFPLAAGIAETATAAEAGAVDVSAFDPVSSFSSENPMGQQL